MEQASRRYIVKLLDAMLHFDSPNSVALTYDEIIFQNRNRAYGAFDLRQHYRPTLFHALWIGVGLFLLGLSAPTLYARFFPPIHFRGTRL